MAHVSFYDQIARNKRNSVLLAVLFGAAVLAFVAAIGWLMVPEFAVLIVLLAGVLVTLDAWWSYKFGDRVVLATVGAKPADPIKHRFLIDSVEGLAIAAGIPAPKAYVYESGEMNAFACGRDPANASIAVSTALLASLKRDELEGVIGHEMSHIANYDIRFATLIAVLVGLAAIVSYMFLRSFRFHDSGDSGKGGGVYIAILIAAVIFAILAPIATRLVQSAVSRKRELLADASGAALTRYPEGLASALEKIGATNKGKEKVSEAVSHIFFVDPNRSPLDELFATHPPLKVRVAALRAM